MPQGTVLGPPLFLIFINNLPEQLHSKVCLFADDYIVYREITNRADYEALLQDLQELETWERIWAMVFHPAKCSAMRVASSKKPCLTPYMLKGISFRQRPPQNIWVSISPTNWTGNPTLTELSRSNLRISSQEIKTLSYIAQGHSNLKYCSMGY